MHGAASRSAMEQMKNLDLIPPGSGEVQLQICTFQLYTSPLFVVSHFTWRRYHVFQEADVETYWVWFCLAFWETVQKPGI